MVSRFSLTRRAAAAIVLAVALLVPAYSEEPPLASKSAILLDATTGAVLYEKDADLEIPPASLTKLMTMHIALTDAEQGRVSLDEVVDIPRSAWAVNQPWGSSLMFLAPGQKVSLRELLLGLAVSSGNDAAVAVAVRLSGSVSAFAERMNEEARAMGLEKTRFVEPSGISEKNMTTAREFARFCARYLTLHPYALDEFHSVREFAYPKPENLPEAFRAKPETIMQRNRNLLLGTVEGVDGLKTGYIIESGFNIALTARRGETRLVAVLLGGPGSSSAQGGRIRADDGGTLLEWGFERFRTIRPVIESLADERVWKGRLKTVALEVGAQLEFTAPVGRAASLSYSVARERWVSAPIAKGAVLGSIAFSDERGVLHSVPLVAKEAVPEGGLLKRVIDSISLFFLRLFDHRA